MSKIALLTLLACVAILPRAWAQASAAANRVDLDEIWLHIATPGVEARLAAPRTPGFISTR